MRPCFVSAITPAPSGFEQRLPSKRDLLGSVIALYAESEAVAEAIAVNYAARMHGVIAVPGEQYAISPLGPLLWRLVVPPTMLPVLHELVSPLLASVQVAATYRDREIELQCGVDRLSLELTHTRDDYNRVATRLQAQLNELMQTRDALAQSESALRALNEDLEQRVQARTLELQMLNDELESFSYSVSHDLRAPLRAISGFSHMLEEDFSEHLPTEARDYLGRINAAADRMDQLIDDLLDLARASKGQMHVRDIDLSGLAKQVFDSMQALTLGRPIDFRVADGLQARGDERMMTVVLENLLGNAVKFTRGRQPAVIEVGCLAETSGPTFFIRDNGAGFDMAAVGKLFTPFQRLHHERDFEGTGVGLATARRVITRHGGRIWAEGQVGMGATFFFTLPNGRQ